MVSLPFDQTYIKGPKDKSWQDDLAVRLSELLREKNWLLRQFKRTEKGLFAERDFKAGEFIGCYEGFLLTSKELHDYDVSTTYAINLGQSRPDGKEWLLGEGRMKFANSLPAAQANMRMDDKFYLYATRDIKAGEELTWPYLREHLPQPAPGATLAAAPASNLT